MEPKELANAPVDAIAALLPTVRQPAKQGQLFGESAAEKGLELACLVR